MKKIISRKAIIIITFVLIFLGTFYFFNYTKIGALIIWNSTYSPSALRDITEEEKVFLEKFVDAAIERTNHGVFYDPSYVAIEYPNGDVPDDTGVCADVIIRTYRELGIDLQKEVHEDMISNFGLYPKIWGLKKSDTNIDHRRVPNLMVFFKRHGQTLPITEDANDYLHGDMVVWRLGHGKTHIGIVIDKLSSDQQRPMIVHNVGAGPKINDVLFEWKIIGHFRYFGCDLEKW